VILLGFTGAGGERTDVLAQPHRFAMGLLAGLAHATLRVPRGRVAQTLSGVAALAVLALAWAQALSAV